MHIHFEALVFEFRANIQRHSRNNANHVEFVWNRFLRLQYASALPTRPWNDYQRIVHLLDLRYYWSVTIWTLCGPIEIIVTFTSDFRTPSLPSLLIKWATLKTIVSTLILAVKQTYPPSYKHAKSIFRFANQRPEFYRPKHPIVGCDMSYCD